MTDLARDLEAAERAMHAALRRIESLTFWGRPSPDSVNGRVLAALETKRDREAPTLEALRAQAARAPRRQAAFTSGNFSAVTRKGPIDPATFPDIPDFLRRERR